MCVYKTVLVTPPSPDGLTLMLILLVLNAEADSSHVCNIRRPLVGVGQTAVTYQMLLPDGIHFFSYLRFYFDYKLLEGENHQLCDSDTK